MSPAAESALERLDAARQKWWFFSLLTTTVLACSASLGVLMACMLTDAYWQLSQRGLICLSVTWLVVTGLLMLLVARRLLRGQRSLEATARRVEAEFPEVGSHLINLVQLASDRKNVSQVFCQAAVNQAAAQASGVSFAAAAAKQSRWRRFHYCMQMPRDLTESFIVLVALAAIALLAEIWLPNWGSAAERLMTPWRFVPSVGSVGILSVKPGDADLLVGSSLEIVAEINNPKALPLTATLFVASQGERESPVSMTADENGARYTATISSIVKPLTYRLKIGDSQTKSYAVVVREKPVVTDVDVTYHFPAYLGRPNETLKQKGLDLQAPQYSVAELRMHVSVPIANGRVEIDNMQYAGRVAEDGMQMTVSLPLLKDGAYVVRLFDNAGHTDPDPRLNRIGVLVDQPPTVELVKPAQESSLAPGGAAPVMIRVGDDHGIDHLRLEMKLKPTDNEAAKAVEPAKPAAAAKAAEATKPAATTPAANSGAPSADGPPADGPPAAIVKHWTDFSGESITSAVRQYRLELKPETAKPGQTVLIRAVAGDKRAVSDWGLELKSQETASGWHAIRIVAAEAKTQAAIEQLEGLRDAIWKILERQVRARVAAGGLLKSGLPSEQVRLAGEVRGDQIEIQKKSSDLVKSIGPSDRPERVTIRETLNALAVGDMLQAVARCDALAKLKTPQEFGKAAPELTSLQDRIIDSLRKLLDVARRAEGEMLSALKNRSDTSLPDDVKQKLQEIRDKLDKFLKEQKKLIEASENLAKKPVDGFTKEEKEKLKDMAATEDDWSKFMANTHSDMSKLPEQDFANASLAKELVEIQTELKMAEDALLKKSVDIAVPLEQLGYEMAEELKTNLEKWLPDSPDREKWSQEESLTDKDKEAPMAELPGELEDLVGDLMEKEEDLFDEMEDVSSSAVDSLDKGAGWDAMDGPISNNSAKGVTGNRLPNTSEIGGRAGEGRQGKSSGEFVSEEAVGKGGRKTPSRLTADPYMKGQIKDHSKEPTGGATGGGKESGKGGEGLEGPASRSPGERDGARLAGKQAALRNRAEALDLRFQVSNFHHTDLKKMIDVMSQVERDVKAGRYRSALRQRKVLAEGLGGIKQYVQGDFQVRQDTTSNLPAEIQKNLLGSMQDPSPSGWEELNRQYFERLSTAGATPAPAAKPAPAASPKKPEAK